MQYDVEIKYKRGSELYLSDTLSRAYLLLEHLPWKADQEVERKPLREIREETAKDPVLQSLKQWFWMDGLTKEKDYLLSCANISSWETSWLLKNVFFQRSKKRHPDESETQD